jgi:hypothetical protein
MPPAARSKLKLLPSWREIETRAVASSFSILLTGVNLRRCSLLTNHGYSSPAPSQQVLAPFLFGEMT